MSYYWGITNEQEKTKMSTYAQEMQLFLKYGKAALTAMSSEAKEVLAALIAFADEQTEENN